MISLEKFENESDMEYAIRILSAKVEHEIDLDWEELVSILNLDVHRDTLRKNWTSSSVSAYHVARYYEDKIKDLKQDHTWFQKGPSTGSEKEGWLEIRGMSESL